MTVALFLERLRAGLERPAAVAADRDRRRLVALGVERLEHRAGRRERDLVLARAPAGDDRDPDAPAHGIVVVGCVVSGGGALEAADHDHDRRALLGLRAALRVLREHSAVEVLVSTISSTDWTSKPDCVSWAVASASVRLVTSGTCEVCGPFETWSVITEPLPCCVPGGRVLPDDDALRRSSSSTSSRATAKPAPCSVDSARSRTASRSRSGP